MKDVPVFENKCDLIEAPKSTKQACISASIVRSLFLFFDLNSVCAENPNSQNHEEANGRIILIAAYNLLIKIKTRPAFFQ